MKNLKFYENEPGVELANHALNTGSYEKWEYDYITGVTDDYHDKNCISDKQRYGIDDFITRYAGRIEKKILEDKVSKAAVRYFRRLIEDI